MEVKICQPGRRPRWSRMRMRQRGSPSWTWCSSSAIIFIFFIFFCYWWSTSVSMGFPILLERIVWIPRAIKKVLRSFIRFVKDYYHEGRWKPFEIFNRETPEGEAVMTSRDGIVKDFLPGFVNRIHHGGVVKCKPDIWDRYASIET